MSRMFTKNDDRDWLINFIKFWNLKGEQKIPKKSAIYTSTVNIVRFSIWFASNWTKNTKWIEIQSLSILCFFSHLTNVVQWETNQNRKKNSELKFIFGLFVEFQIFFLLFLFSQSRLYSDVFCFRFWFFWVLFVEVVENKSEQKNPKKIGPKKSKF